jgi:hypothetical protein
VAVGVHDTDTAVWLEGHVNCDSPTDPGIPVVTCCVYPFIGITTVGFDHLGEGLDMLCKLIHMFNIREKPGRFRRDSFCGKLRNKSGFWRYIRIMEELQNLMTVLMHTDLRILLPLAATVCAACGMTLVFLGVVVDA